ncbi:hypothetical protein CKM354_000900800 [Cercospora kikuchii]|uniref:Type VI secretion system tube protein Hcp n=1 Tax=Cercospora kikuchii TaxID=84275 RepID=A0A9P3CN49_9PEZI|nr:uncharacterized protein CKM354_000900800 [Cercospora kikuchii]GIZ45859.1 hypothetical protein CKM354_000900800 [Cercospora kikuchii]
MNTQTPNLRKREKGLTSPKKVQLLDSNNNKLFTNKGQPSFTPQSTLDQTISISIASGIPISSYSLSFTNNATSDPANARFIPGKLTTSGLELTRTFDQWSPLVFHRLASATTFKTLVLVNFSNVGAGGGNRIMSVLTFSNVLLVNQSIVGSGDGAGPPTENLQFIYGKVQVAYQPMEASGKAGNPVQADWDLFGNKGSVS